jgi:hypothetical protein
MNYRFLKSACVAALMASGGQALAQVSGTDTIQVTLAVEVAKSITLELEGDAALTETETINESFDGFPPRSIEVKKGFTTGCLTLEGVQDITVKVTGVNIAPGTPEPVLRGQGAASDVYLSYYQVLAIAPAGTNFDTMFATSRGNSPGALWYYSNYVGSGDTGDHTNGASNDLFGAPSKLGPAACTNNSPNIAFGAMVGVENSVASILNGANRVYGAINPMLNQETGLATGTYNFTDTVTVLVTPKIG